MNTLQMLEFGGSPTRQEDTTHVVCLWHIPGSCDHVNAVRVYAYFSDEKMAKAFETQYMYIPEMAIMLTIAKFDYIQIENTSRNASVYFTNWV